MEGQLFTHEEIFADTYVIRGGWCDCYLLLGEDEGIMIDAGSPVQNIREYAQSITNLPVTKVINTHGHIDHTAGNGFFDTVYCTMGTAKTAKNTLGKDPGCFLLDYTPTIVEDAEVIPLKGRPLEMIQLGSHSPGSIAVLDPRGSLLFSGDEIEAGQVLLLPGYAEELGQIHSHPSASLETYMRTLLKLKADKNWRRYYMICPAHNGAPIPRNYIDRFINLLHGTLGRIVKMKKDCSSATYTKEMAHFPLGKSGYVRVEEHGAALVFHEKLFFDVDYSLTETFPPATQAHLDAAKTARQ